MDDKCEASETKFINTLWGQLDIHNPEEVRLILEKAQSQLLWLERKVKRLVWNLP